MLQKVWLEIQKQQKFQWCSINKMIASLAISENKTKQGLCVCVIVNQNENMPTFHS